MIILLFLFSYEILARRNILKARLNNETDDLEEDKKLKFGILNEGDAYDEYDYEDEDFDKKVHKGKKIFKEMEEYDSDGDEEEEDDDDEDDDDDDDYDDLDDEENDPNNPWNMQNEELQKRLKKLIKRMDSNKDSKISEIELVIWTFKAIHNIDAKENAHHDFDAIDKLEDNQISWQEFMEDEYGEIFEVEWDEIDENELAIQVNDRELLDLNRNYKRIHSRFMAADKDESGKLSKEEFLLFKNPFSDEYTKDIWLELALQNLDLNENGMLEKSEFNQDWLYVPKEYDYIRDSITNDPDKSDKEFILNYKDKHNGKYLEKLYTLIRSEDDSFQDILDVNRNEVLDGPDLLLWLAPENADMAWDEVSDLFDLCDENEDGFLTEDEILEEMDLWLDSDATEYGDQLRFTDEL